MRRTVWAGLALFAISLCPPAPGAELHVSGEGDDSLGTGSQDSPYRTITRALLNAGSGDVIRVHEGVYRGDYGEIFPLDMEPGVSIVGDGPAEVLVCGADDTPVIRFREGIAFPSETRVEGLWITCGGVAVWIAVSADAGAPSEPILVGNRIGYSTLEGVLLLVEEGATLQVELEGNEISGNWAGGIVLDDFGIRTGAGSPSMGRLEARLSGNLIRRNGSRSPGRGGVDMNGQKGTLRLEDNLVDDNFGPGILVSPSMPGCQVWFDRNYIWDNGTEGIHLRAGSAANIAATFTNNLIHGNNEAGLRLRGYQGLSASAGRVDTLLSGNTILWNGSAGVVQDDAAYTDIRNTIIWGHATDLVEGECCPAVGSLLIAYSDFQSTEGENITLGSGVISAEPVLADPERGRFHLLEGSPCIDAGTSDQAPPTDMEGRARIDHPGVENTGGGTSPWYDMGAFELEPAREFHVSETGSDTGGDGSTTSPFRSITHALEASRYGDTVLVHEGIYNEREGEAFPIDMVPGVAVIGDGPGIAKVNGLESLPVFRFRADTAFSPAGKLEGLTIKDGSFGVLAAHNYLNRAGPSEPVITRNVIRGNVGDGIHVVADDGGSGLMPAITGNDILENGGAGIGSDSRSAYPGYWSYGEIDLHVVDNKIRRNASGGVNLDDFTGSMEVTSNLIRGNTGWGIQAETYGNIRPAVVSRNVIRGNSLGGLNIYSGYSAWVETEITNNLIKGNNVSGMTLYGYVGYFGSSGTVDAVISNNTIAYNGARGFLQEGEAYSLVTNTIVWGHDIDVEEGPGIPWFGWLTVSFSDFASIRGKLITLGEGNLDSEPLFADARHQDFTLTPESPCVDSGTSDGAPPFDTEGRARVDYPGVPNRGGGDEPWYDMGAWELPFTDDRDGDGSPDSEDCLPDDGAAWGRPGPVEGLTLTHSPGGVVLDWAPQEDGGLPVYDIAAGPLGSLSQDGGFSRASCLAGDLLENGYSDATASSEARWYLVRARTACPDGTGSFGNTHLPSDPRDLLDDPEESPINPCP